MNAEDFRIGNYLHDREGRLCRVEELSCREGEREVYAPAISGPITSLPNKPIPLTGEWMRRLGAKPFPNGDTELQGHLYTYAECQKEYIHIQTGKYLKYVHQIQNLYHALTGEELKRQ